jgi:hypothetical protein
MHIRIIQTRGDRGRGRGGLYLKALGMMSVLRPEPHSLDTHYIFSTLAGTNHSYLLPKSRDSLDQFHNFPLLYIFTSAVHSCTSGQLATAWLAGTFSPTLLDGSFTTISTKIIKACSHHNVVPPIIDYDHEVKLKVVRTRMAQPNRDPWSWDMSNVLACPGNCPMDAGPILDEIFISAPVRRSDLVQGSTRRTVR